MPEPASLPEWASNTNYSDPGETWDGTATKVEPSAGQKQNGNTPEPPAAQHHNWWFNTVYKWLEWWHSNLRFASNNALLQNAGEYKYSATKSRTVTVDLPLGFNIANTDLWDLNSSAEWDAAAANSLVFPLNPYLNTGNVLQTIKVICTPANTAALTVVLTQRTKDFTTGSGGSTSQVGSTGSSSGTSLQVVTVGSLAYTINRANTELFLNITAGQASDVLKGIQLTFDDAGPRND